jgi:hypothetical protein
MPLDKEIVKVQIRDTTTIRIEATDLGGPKKTGVLDKVDFDGISEAIGDIARALGDTLAAVKPQKASIEFGVEIGWEAGKLVALLCQGSGKANIKVAVEWSERSGSMPGH